MLKKCLLAVILTTGAVNADKFEFNTIKRDASGNIKDSGQVIPDEKVIISTGYGTTKEQALKNAFKSAIEQYIGVFVDSETMIKNGKLIKDNILTASNGFIKKYDEISVDKQDGLVEMKIKAVVKSQKVFKKIKKLKISTISIDNTKDIYARVITKRKSKEDALKILEKHFDELFSASSIQDMLNIKIISAKVEEDKIENNRVPIKIVYELSISYSTYMKKIKKLEELFKNIGGTLHKRVHIYKLNKITSMNDLIKQKSIFTGYSLPQRNSKFLRPIKFYFSNNKTLEKLSKKYTPFGIVKKYGENYRLDVWSFPKEWESLYYGKNRNIYKILRGIIEIKDSNNNVLLATELKEIAGESFIGTLNGNEYSQSNLNPNIKFNVISPTFYTNVTVVRRETRLYISLKKVADIQNITLELEER